MSFCSQIINLICFQKYFHVKFHDQIIPEISLTIDEINYKDVFNNQRFLETTIFHLNLLNFSKFNNQSNFENLDNSNKSFDINVIYNEEFLNENLNFDELCTQLQTNSSSFLDKISNKFKNFILKIERVMINGLASFESTTFLLKEVLVIIPLLDLSDDIKSILIKIYIKRMSVFISISTFYWKCTC